MSDPKARTAFLEEVRQINPKYDTALLERAYEKADEAHEGQLRKSGDPYITHPANVALILANLGMDDETLAAGLLHDTVEDTSYTIEELRADFGDEVASLVDGVTKLGNLVFENKEEAQAENLRKMFLAMSKDIRVLIIKLADRLHNMRTIDYMTEAKIREKCRETLDIYAPLASRLGMYAIKFEMEDIALKELDPTAYHEIAQAVSMKKAEREAQIERIISELKKNLDALGIQYNVYGRSKHFYSIYRKMKYQNRGLDEIFDLLAIRIIVQNVRDCYAVLGVVHTLWKPVPGRFKDYVAMPKTNNYQSIHTTVFGADGKPFEIQIRTEEMHHIAEYGIAAHWKYKEGLTAASKEETEENKLAWLRQTLEWQKDLNDSKEFMETLKVDLFAHQVFVFTPKGDIIELPAGSTPLDFAYKIHSAVGNKCVGAKVNGKMVPIDYQLKNSEIVDIVTNPNSKGPSIDWLKIAKSNTARHKIRAYLKKEGKDASAEKGRELLEKHLKRKSLDPQLLMKPVWLSRAARTMNLNSAEELCTELSGGGAILTKVSLLLQQYYHEEVEEELRKKEQLLPGQRQTINRKQEEKKQGGISVEGMSDILIRLAKCCNPVPGDEIVGFITKGRGVSVHRKDCINVLSMPEEEKARFIHVEWNLNKENDYSYGAEIHIVAEDRRGLFADLSHVCEDMDVNISAVNAKANPNNVSNITMTIQISNTGQIEKVLQRLRLVPGVVDVYRSIL